jgi:hypothetical protein
MTDYTRRVRNANTPKDALAVIDEAVDDARSDGRFDPEQMRRELRKAIMLGPDPSDDDLARLEANAAAATDHRQQASGDRHGAHRTQDPDPADVKPVASQDRRTKSRQADPHRAGLRVSPD